MLIDKQEFKPIRLTGTVADSNIVKPPQTRQNKRERINMTDENASDKENRPKFGSGCLVPFIFFFGFSFYCGVKDGNIAGSIVAFSIMTFFLTKFLHPKPRKPKPYYPPHKNGTSSRDTYDDGFDEGLAAGFFMAESMRHDGAPDSADADAYEEWGDEGY